MSNVTELHKFIDFLRQRAAKGDQRAKEVVHDFQMMEVELESLRAFKKKIDEDKIAGQIISGGEPDDFPRDQFKRGDPGHPDNEMGM